MRYYHTRARFQRDGEFDYAIEKDRKIELEVFGRVGPAEADKRDAAAVAKRVTDFLNGEGTFYVIMANDFPEGIMNDQAAAEELVTQRNATDKARRAMGQPGWGSTAIYWKVYPFALNQVKS